MDLFFFKVSRHQLVRKNWAEDFSYKAGLGPGLLNQPLVPSPPASWKVMFRDAVEPDDFASSMILSECERRQLLQVEVGFLRWGKFRFYTAIHLDDVKRCEKEEIVVVSTRCPPLLGLQRLVCHLKILVKLGGMLPVTT